LEDRNRTITLIGGPYDGDSFTGTVDDDVGEPTEFSLFLDGAHLDTGKRFEYASDPKYQIIYRVNDAGEWHYHGARVMGAFTSVEPTE
jgi:hypothetical protein